MLLINLSMYCYCESVCIKNMRGLYMKQTLIHNILICLLPSIILLHQFTHAARPRSYTPLPRVTVSSHPLNTISEEPSEPLSLANMLPLLKIELKKAFKFGSLEYKRAVEICLTELFDIEKEPGALINNPQGTIKKVIAYAQKIITQENSAALAPKKEKNEKTVK